MSSVSFFSSDTAHPMACPLLSWSWVRSSLAGYLVLTLLLARFRVTFCSIMTTSGASSFGTFLFAFVVSICRCIDTLGTGQHSSNRIFIKSVRLGIGGSLGEPAVAGKFGSSSTFPFASVVSNNRSVNTFFTGEKRSGESLVEPATARKFESSSTFLFAVVVSACRSPLTLGSRWRSCRFFIEPAEA